MKIIKKYKVIIISISIVSVIFLLIIPPPVNGKWKTDAIACMCDSYNFLVLKNGQVFKYTGNHTPYKTKLGTYKNISYNKYQINYEYGIFGYFKPGWIYGTLKVEDDSTYYCWRIFYSKQANNIIKKSERISPANR